MFTQNSYTQESQIATGTAPVQTFRSATRLVVLDVVVTDKSGNQMRRLTKDDFTVLEDGIQQNITSFETPEPDAPFRPRQLDKESNGHTAATGAEGSHSLDIIVLDELNCEFLDQAYARQSIEKFLRTHGPHLPNPTSLMMLGQKRLELLHDYTHDAGALLLALHNRQAELPFGLMSGEATGAGDRLAKTLAGLQLIAEANVHSAGRKNVIWVGPGFPSLNADFTTQPDVQGPIRDAGNLLLDARIAVYTVDPRGLEVSPTDYGLYDFGDQTTGELIFEQIAPATGGNIFRLGNSIDEEIAKSIDDGSAYYTLSYYPSNREWNGKFRRIQVVPKMSGLVARTRRGYFGKPESPADDSELDTILSRAVISPLPYRALEVQASAKVSGSLPRTGHFKILVDRQRLEWQTLENGDRRCEITVVQAGISNKGEVIAHSVREMEGIVGSRKFTKEWNKPMEFAVTSEVPANISHFRIVVRDYLSGDIGTTDVSF